MERRTHTGNHLLMLDDLLHLNIQNKIEYVEHSIRLAKAYSNRKKKKEEDSGPDFRVRSIPTPCNALCPRSRASKNKKASSANPNKILPRECKTHLSLSLGL